MIVECDPRLERYRAALDAGADPVVVTGWIAAAQADRSRAEAVLAGPTTDTGRRRMSREETAAMVDTLGDIAAVLRDADPDDKAEVHRQLGVRLTYHPETRTVYAEADLGGHRHRRVRHCGLLVPLPPPGLRVDRPTVIPRGHVPAFLGSGRAATGSVLSAAVRERWHYWFFGTASVVAIALGVVERDWELAEVLIWAGIGGFLTMLFSYLKPGHRPGRRPRSTRADDGRPAPGSRPVRPARPGQTSRDRRATPSGRARRARR